MAWTAPPTLVIEELVDVNDFNTYIRDDFLYLKKKVYAIPMLSEVGGLVLSNPGTSYTAMSGTTLPNAQSRIDWSQLESSIQARIIVTASGSEGGSGKGIAVYETTASTKLAEVTWNGTAAQRVLASAWTDIASGILTADRVIEIQVKGSSPTEDLALYRVEFQVKG